MIGNFITEHCYLFLVVAMALILSIIVWMLNTYEQCSSDIIDMRKMFKKQVYLNEWYRKILIEIYDQDFIEKAEQEFIEKHQL